jgi:ferritin
MLSKKMLDALNNQVKNEMFSWHLYHSMALHFEAMNFKGFAAWMKAQAAEEMGHANKFVDFIIERGGRVVLPALEKPQTEWSSHLAAFQDAVKHEQFITAEINKLVDLAHAENDHPAHYFLGWFVSEQVEEEASVGEVAQKLEMIGASSHAIFMFDAVLGKRGQ